MKKNEALYPLEQIKRQLAQIATSLGVTNTRNCMKKGSFLLHNAKTVVRVLEPINTSGFGPDDVARLRKLTRDRVREGVETLRADEARSTAKVGFTTRG